MTSVGDVRGEEDCNYFSVEFWGVLCSVHVAVAWVHVAFSSDVSGAVSLLSTTNPSQGTW